MATRVRRLHVFTGEVASVLVDTSNGCPKCGAKVEKLELEWEVSGLPVTLEENCSSCSWGQGWDPTHEWTV